MANWFLKSNNANIELMSKDLGISPVMASVLANRGMRTRQEALDFLYPDVKSLCDESKLADIEKAAKTLYHSLKNSEKIAVYGDYDVDGVVSTYMLYSELRRLNANAVFYMPHREEDGYGLNNKAISYLKSENVDLLITCDNGISAVDEIAYAKKLGMKVIVIDHHEVRREQGDDGVIFDVLPAADAVIDPKREDCRFESKQLCAGALCYVFLKYFYKYIEADFHNENEMLCFAAIATVCDIVDMKSDSRAIVKHGLEILNSVSVNVGLSALIKLRGLKGKKLNVFSLGYVIGPCLNAAGRLKSAEWCVELFLTQDPSEAEARAQKLTELNEERKSLTHKYVEEAMTALKSGSGDDKVIVMLNEYCHESLSGIVAGRIKDVTNHPVLAITRSGEYLKGSARSIEGYNMFEALSSCKDLFVKFGGHGMAAGFTLEERNLEPLRKRLNDECRLEEKDFEPTYKIEKALSINDISFELAKELKRLEPYGSGNPEPLFGTKDLIPELCEIIGESGTTMRIMFTDLSRRKKIKAICFNKVEKFASMIKSKLSEDAAAEFLNGRLKPPAMLTDIVYTIEINEYNNNEYRK